jgi:hypothetical protein
MRQKTALVTVCDVLSCPARPASAACSSSQGALTGPSRWPASSASVAAVTAVVTLEDGDATAIRHARAAAAFTGQLHCRDSDGEIVLGV